MGFLYENGLISKTKSMFSSLSNIIWRSSMQILETQRAKSTYKQYCHCHKLTGLKTLVYEPGTLQTQSLTQQLNPLITHSYTNPQQSSPPPMSSSSTWSEFLIFDTHSTWTFGLDDIIGTESGVFLFSGTFEMLETECKQNDYKRKKPRRTRVVEYPPPIPLLARTGNLQPRMPWTLGRYYHDGRLILKEEKVKHHEYFEIYRENGRLILELVSLDASVRCCHTVFEENDDEEQGQEQEQQEIELEDLEFYQGYQESEKVEEAGEEEENDGSDDEEDNVDGKVNQRSMTSASSVPEFCKWGETFEDPRKCLSLTSSGRITTEPSSVVSQC